MSATAARPAGLATYARLLAGFEACVRRLGRARAALAGQEARAATALLAGEGLPTALLSRDGRLRRANAAFLRLAPVERGSPAEHLVAEASRAALARWIARETEGASPDRLTATLVSGVEISLYLTRSADGALIQMLDLSRERGLERQLSQTHRLQAVGELAAGIAHDFNNLLTAITAAVDELAVHAPDESMAEELRQIRGSAERGADLVRQILAFSQQQTLQPRVIPANDAVSAIARMLQRTLGRAITLRLRLEQPGRMIRVDPGQLDQVLVNLAVNARHAMPDGGMLTLQTAHATVVRPLPTATGLLPPGRYVTIEASDTGCGIPPGLLPRIFDPFFTTRREAGGSGLGLSTVHGILRQSGGHIEVRSTPGEGSSFRLFLPRCEAAAGAPAGRRLAVATPGAPPARRLLLVEDEAQIRALAERVLRREGWDVLSAGSGEEALRLLPADAVPPCCVISDVMMPGMDGPALVRALRARWAGLPAVLISGYAGATLRQELAIAELRFLAKPFAMRALAEAVAAAAPA